MGIKTSEDKFLEDIINSGKQQAIPQLPTPQSSQPSQPSISSPQNKDDDFINNIINLGKQEAPASSFQPQLQRQAPPEPSTPSPVFGEFGKGFGSGLRQIRTDVTAVAGLGADLFGQEDIGETLLNLAVERVQAEPPPTVEFKESVDSFENFVRFASRTLGEQVPVIASIILGGGIGTVAGRLVARKALTNEAAERIVRRASVTGAVSAATGIETGATGIETFEATGEARPLTSLAAGIAKGSLEAIVPLAFARRFGFASKEAGDLLSRLTSQIDKVDSRVVRALTAATGGGTIEGATEFLQEAIDITVRGYVDENFDVLGEQAANRLKEAAGTGALVGFLLGGAGGGLTSRREPGEEQRGEGEIPLPPTEENVLDTQGAQPLQGQQDVTPFDLPPVPTTPPGAPEPGPDVGIESIEADLPQPVIEVSTPRPPGTFRPEAVRPEAIQEGPIEDELSTEIFAITKDVADDDLAGNASFSFRRPEDIVERVGFAGRRNVRLLKIRKADLEGLDLTSTLNELPLEANDLTPTSLGVEFIQQGNESRALSLAQAAISARNDAIDSGNSIGNAERFLADAEQNGFRLRPQRESQGFTIIGKLPETFETKGLPAVATGGFSEGLSDQPFIFVDGPETGSTPTFTPLGFDARSGVVNPESRRFAVDVSKLDPTKLFLSSADEVLKALDKITGKTNSLLNEGQIRELLLIARAENQVSFETEDLGSIVEEVKSLGGGGRLENLIQAGRFRVSPVSAVSQNSLAFQGKLPVGALRELPSSIPQSRRFGVRQPNQETPSDAILPSEYRDKKNNTYALANHKAGTALFITRDKNLSSEMKKRMVEIEAFYSSLLSKFNLSSQKIILTTDTIPEFGFVPNIEEAGGSYFSLRDNVSVIWLQDPNLTPAPVVASPKNFLREKFITTAAHEFGHFLTFTEQHSASQGTLAQLESAYNRALTVANSGNLKDFRKAFFPPTRFATPLLDFNETLLIANISTGPSYWFSYDEWFADQFARWVTTGGLERRPIDLVERFMKKLATKMRRLFSEAFRLRNLSIKDFRPEPEVQSYLDSLARRRQLTNIEPLGLSARDLSTTKTETFAPDNGPVPESPANEPLGALASIDGLPSETVKRFKEIKRASDYFNWVAKWGWGVLQIAQKNRHIVWLQEYVQTLDLWYNTKMRWMARGEATVREWRQLKGKQLDNLARFLFAVDQMEYRTTKEIKDKILRQPTEQELVLLARRMGVDQRSFDQFIRIRGDLNSVLDDIERILLVDLNRTMQGAEAIIEESRLKKEFRDMRQRPYFPHMRFGEFTVTVRNKEGKLEQAEQFTSRKQARRALSRLQKDFPPAQGFKIGLGKLPESVEVFRGLPPSLLKSVRNKLDLSKEQQQALDVLIVDMAPGKSFRKQFARRENIKGFSQDALRTYSNYMWHASNHMARIEFGSELQKIITEGRGQTGGLLAEGFDVVKRFEILDFIQDHLTHILNPKPDWAQLRSIAFQWWLGFSPASAVLNFTQMPIVAWPYLSARFNDVSAANEMRKALVGLRKLYSSPETFTSKLSVEDEKLFTIAFDQGFIEESIAKELAGTAEGSTLSRISGRPELQRSMQQFAHLSGLMFQTSEKINRRVVFKAAVELSRKNPDNKYLNELKTTFGKEFRELTEQQGLAENEALAFLAGKDAVRATQFEYASWARPRFMRGKPGVLFTFFMFVQNMLWFTFNQAGNKRMMLMLLLMGGLMGLPGAEDLNSIVRFIGRNIFGKDYNPEKEVREFLVEVVGSDEPDLFLYGAGRVGFGLPAAFDSIGIPFPSFDMSASVGLGQIIPGVAELGRPAQSFSESFSRAGTDIAGASFGIGLNILKALSDSSLPVDDFKRWERAMPRAMRNMARAVRFYDEERERTRGGATVIDFDPTSSTDLMEIVAQGMGFTPTRLSRAWDKKAAVREVEQFWGIRRGMILRQFDYAQEIRSAEGRRDAMAAVRKYNNEVPFNSMGISSKQLRSSRKERERRRRLEELGISQQRGIRPLTDEIGRLFPEVPDPRAVDKLPEEEAQDVTGVR